MATPRSEDILNHLKVLAASPPQHVESRKQLYEAAKACMQAVESPMDTVYRVIYSPLLITFAQTATHLRIFSLLAAADGSLTSNQIATAAGTDAVLTARILRYLASHGLITETGEDQFQANDLTRTLATDWARAGLNQGFQGIAPAMQAAPEFFQRTHYRNPDNIVDTPFQAAFKTELPAFLWLQNRPDLVADFGLWMTALHDGRKTWLDVVDFPSLIKASEIANDAPAFVDVGGGIGSQCALLRAKLPHLAGRIILQDLPVVIDHALALNRVEKMPFDFWNEQPIKNARAYYFRNIFHDYPEEKCLTLLENTVRAMGPDSVILIDDMIMPNVGAHPHATEQDMVMLTTLASMERTEKQWDTLLAKANLKVLHRAKYLDDTADSIQQVVPQ